MSIINALAAGAPTAKSTGTESTNAAAASAKDLENRFLTLLVSQLKNQDPLNPLDNAQLTTQLAQISTVGGIDRMNATLTAIQNLLTAQMAATRASSSSSSGRTTNPAAGTPAS